MAERSGTVPRVAPVRKIFEFPGSQDQVEIITYRNPDGSFKSVECVMITVRTSIDEINSYLLSLIDYSETARFNLYVHSKDRVTIGRISEIAGHWNYDEVETVLVLSEENIVELKTLVIKHTSAFMELLTNYYEESSLATIASETDQLNQALSTLLKFSANANVKGLDTLFALYVALDCQTYFDVVGRIVMIGTYTLSSIFAITEMYHTMYNKLRGNESLRKAKRKTFTDDDRKMVKGEIHTSSGLILLHTRQFKIFGPRRVRQPRQLGVYEDIVFEDLSRFNLNESVNENIDSGNVEIEPKVTLDPEAVYNSTQYRRILKFGRDEVLDDLLTQLVDKLDEEKVSFRAIKPARVAAIFELLRLFDDARIAPTFLMIKPYMSHEHDDTLLKIVGSIEGLEGDDKAAIFRKFFVPFLAYNDAIPEEGAQTLLERLVSAKDKIDVLTDVIRKFITCG